MFRINTKPSTLINLLESITTTTPHPPTLVIICMSRSDLLAQMQAEIVNQQQRPDEIPASQDEDGEPIELELEPETEPVAGAGVERGNDADMTTDIDADLDTTSTITTKNTPPAHGLLTPTLHLLSRSTTTRLAFCSSINSLRAYVASYSHSYSHGLKTKAGTPTPRIILLNALSLHTGTSEFSMQGLSQTFANIVGMAWRVGAELRVVEGDGGGDGMGYGEKWPWDVEVPLLSVGVGGGVASRPGGVGSWAGRRVKVGDVLGRWFVFE